MSAAPASPRAGDGRPCDRELSDDGQNRVPASQETAPPLTRERVLCEALGVADERGIDALSMRRLGQLLGVEAMSLYRHVADTDDLLDGIADLVMAEIEPPSTDTDLRPAIRRSAISVHDALRRHPGPVPPSG